ncbi:hypothetical protein [Actinophytocola sp.]|uniref:hypothetical protein n=1 Tax=Actinophytocola sp. TaxID=1872138 RepID=UPI003D6B709B
MLAELTAGVLLAAGLVLTAGSAALLVGTRRTRRAVRSAGWLLTRASLAVAEARRASVVDGLNSKHSG